MLIILQFLYNIFSKYSYLSSKYCHRFKKLILILLLLKMKITFLENGLQS